MGFGGKVFRNPPEDLFPAFDTPEAAITAEYLRPPHHRDVAARRHVIH